MTARDALVGTWKMVSLQRETVATGVRTDAMGPDPGGFLTYGVDGRVAIHLVAADRPHPRGAKPTDAEKVALFDTMLSYAGTWTLDDEKVVHHIEASWNQRWNGTDQVRFYHLDGDHLTISSPPAPDPLTGEQVAHHVVFRRLPMAG